MPKIRYQIQNLKEFRDIHNIRNGPRISKHETTESVHLLFLFLKWHPHLKNDKCKKHFKSLKRVDDPKITDFHFSKKSRNITIFHIFEMAPYFTKLKFLGKTFKLQMTTKIISLVCKRSKTGNTWII